MRVDLAGHALGDLHNEQGGDMALQQLKRELEQFGERNDDAQPTRGSKMLNITRDTGELLAVLVQTRGLRPYWRLAPPTVIPLSGWPKRCKGSMAESPP